MAPPVSIHRIMTERYQITSLIEETKLGAIYLAQDATLQRKVIFRVFDKKINDASHEGFSQYTGKLCALQHPNLLTIYDITRYGDGYCMVTQVLEAESLEERLKKGALSQVGVYNMACDVLDALHAAHSSELYHGAMRTDSIKRIPRVRGGHRYVIVDFGLDRISSMICGAPVFLADPVLMAPELIEGVTFPNASTDLFTLGQLCYSALVGGHPYVNKTPPERVHAYKNGGLPHLSTYVQGVQPDFANWVMSMVSGFPDDRPKSAQEAMATLQAITLNTSPPNVPGKTQAIESPGIAALTGQILAPHPNPTPPSGFAGGGKLIADRPVKKVRTYQPPIESEEKNRRFLFISTGVIVILLAILATVFFIRKDFFYKKISIANQTKTEAEQLVILDKKEIHLQPVVGNTSFLVTFDDDKLLDWTIIMGAPASTARKLKNGSGGGYIKNIIANGGFKEFVHPHNNVIFNTGKFTATYREAITNASHGHAKKGEGWDITIKVPKNQKKPLKVTLYMHQKLCNFDLRVRLPESSEKASFSIPETSTGIIKIPITIKKPVKGYYSIGVYAIPSEENVNFEMGLIGILVE